MSLPDKQFVEIKNERLAYIQKGEGKDVILLHGNMSSSAHFLPFFRKAPQGIRLTAPDMRGFGDSTYNVPFDSLKELADDIIEFMDALRIPKAHFFGWSAGGGVALRLAAHYPTRVASIFSAAGAGHKGYPIFRKNPDGSSTGAPYANKAEMASDPVQVAPCIAALKAQNAAFFEAVWSHTIYNVNKPSPEDNKLYIAETLKQRCLVDLDWALARFNMSSAPNSYSSGDGSISRVICPVTFTWGDKDLPVPYHMVSENVAAVANSLFLKYENCGHSPFVDCPDRVVKDFCGFIKNL